MSKDSIRLHKKHGLNPTIPVCFFCGKEKGEIALLGAAYKEKAPRNMVVDRQPCEECASWMKQGVIFIETQDGQEGQDLLRTGRMAVLKEGWVERAMEPQVCETLLKSRACFIPKSIADALGIFKTMEEGEAADEN